MNEVETVESFFREKDLNFFVEKKGALLTVFEKDSNNVKYKLFRFSEISDNLYTLEIPKGRKWENIPIQGDVSTLLHSISENFPWLIDDF